MNPLRTVPRAAFGAYVKAVRFPFDQAARLLGRRDAEVALDQAEAGARDAAGAVLGDQEMRRDATRRRTAADEREKAQSLKAEAAETRQRSKQQAARRRQRSDQVAAEQRKALRARERADRLEALDEQAEALEAEQDALTARDEARRLKSAAAKVKAGRTG
jgi:hypothetical protein